MNEMFQFDPVLYSDRENEFILENAGKPPIVALKSVPFGANSAAVGPVIRRVYELDQQQEHEGIKWVGVEKLKESIKKWLTTNLKWREDSRRTKKAPRWPSLFAFDARGRGHRAGPGSDSGIVKTYFGPAGERIPFAIDLMPDYRPEWQAPTMTEAPMSPQLHIDAESHRIECRVPTNDGLCGHTESYKAESRSSYNAARARMSKHLRKAVENSDAHRELHTLEYGE
jgi:hypothetical protein